TARSCSTRTPARATCSATAGPSSGSGTGGTRTPPSNGSRARMTAGAKPGGGTRRSRTTSARSAPNHSPHQADPRAASRSGTIDPIVPPTTPHPRASSVVIGGSAPSRSEPPRIADHGGSTIVAAHDATPQSSAKTTPASAPRRAASGRAFAASPAVRPPINDAAAGIARNRRYQAGNAAVVDGAPTSAANPAPMFPFVWNPD